VTRQTRRTDFRAQPSMCSTRIKCKEVGKHDFNIPVVWGILDDIVILDVSLFLSLSYQARAASFRSTVGRSLANRHSERGSITLELRHLGKAFWGWWASSYNWLVCTNENTRFCMMGNPITHSFGGSAPKVHCILHCSLRV
jgi:hypothetical protein